MPHRDFEHLSPWKQLLIAAGIGVTGLVGFSQRDKLPWPPFNKADSSLEDTVKDASCGRHGSGTSASPDGYERRMINGDKWRFTPNASKLMDAYFRAIADVQGQPLTESFIYLLCTLADTNGDKIIKDTEAQALCNRFLGKYGHKSGNIAPTNLYLPCTQRAEFFPRETASEFLLLCHAGSAQWVATYDAYTMINRAIAVECNAYKKQYPVSDAELASIYNAADTSQEGFISTAEGDAYARPILEYWGFSKAECDEPNPARKCEEQGQSSPKPWFMMPDGTVYEGR